MGNENKIVEFVGIIILATLASLAVAIIIKLISPNDNHMKYRVENPDLATYTNSYSVVKNGKCVEFDSEYNESIVFCGNFSIKEILRNSR